MAALSARLQLPAAIAEAAAGGNLQLDDMQRDYLSALLGTQLPEAANAVEVFAASSAGMFQFRVPTLYGIRAAGGSATADRNTAAPGTERSSPSMQVDCKVADMCCHRHWALS